MPNKRLEFDLAINTSAARQGLKSIQGDVSELSKALDRNLGRSIDGLIKGTKTLKDLLRETAHAITAEFIKSKIPTHPAHKGFSGILSGLAGFAGFFDSGGVVPGSFSQPVPLVAHGSEMILNPGQQSKLFNMLNGQAKGKGGQPNFVYAPQIKTGASASEVFDVLNRHSRQFFGMVAEGVHTDNSLRNAVKGA